MLAHLARGEDPVARNEMPQGNDSRKTPAKRVLTRVGDLVEFYVLAQIVSCRIFHVSRRFFSGTHSAKIQSPSFSRRMRFICRMREVPVKTDVGPTSPCGAITTARMQRRATPALATTITRRKSAISTARIRSAFLAIAVHCSSVQAKMISEGADNFATIHRDPQL